jgi:hypothetical protein
MVDTVLVAVIPARPAYKGILDGLVMYPVLERTPLQKKGIQRTFKTPTGSDILQIYSLNMTLTNVGGGLRVTMLNARTVIEGPIEKVKGNIPLVGRCQMLKIPPITSQTQNTVLDLVR